MGLILGNNNIGSIYVGSTKIGEAYLGSTKVYSSAPASQYPYLLLQCDGYNNTHPDVSSVWTNASGEYTWTQISTSPNVWRLDITKWAIVPNLGIGLVCLFSTQSSPPVGTIMGSCKLIGSGNMDMELNSYYCQSMDRMFAGCVGLTYIDPIHSTLVQNVGGMFSGCTAVEEGALAQYNWFNTYGTSITNHSGTFTDCGLNTTTGLAELNQIPVGWGGNLVPASTLMTSSVKAYSSRNYTAWEITGNAPNWTNIVDMYFFTQASVSQYAGVSMNRSRIPNGLNGFGSSSSYELYFYPAFVQCTMIPGQSGNEVYWIATTDTPNGSLTTNQDRVDMPGTLDYSTYGPITRIYGTYDSAKPVYFVFLVTNYPITDYDTSTTTTDDIPMAFLWNTSFKSDAGLRYFF